MKKMRRNGRKIMKNGWTRWVDKLKNIIYAAMALMVVIVLALSGHSFNDVESSRPTRDYTVLSGMTYKQVKREDAPIGVVNEYCFQLGQIDHDDTLAFYINHHNIQVYFDEECVYTMTEMGETFHTSGGVWAMIPLDDEDAGKIVRVVLAPVYDNYQDEKLDFLIGSELAIYRTTLREALPEIILSMCVVLAGVFLLFLAAYHKIKRNFGGKIYAVGMLAVSAGVWRFTYGRFAYLLFSNRPVLIYTMSVISLMTLSIALLNCVDVSADGKGSRTIRGCTLVYCLIYIAQLILQSAGVWDLRQMLKITHVTIIFSAVVLCIDSVLSWVRRPEYPEEKVGPSYSWMIGVGVMIDLVLYYYAESSSGMLYTLGAILCFSMLESFRLIVNYTEKKNELEEMMNKLAMSRTMTMMSQIRSHFVFNLLNAISGMCKYDPEKADDTIVRFARYLRSNIDIMENDQNIPFATDLNQLEDYVMLEQVRFGDKVEFYTDIETDQFMIPPLILQPVVENAIKHGISKKQTNGTIVLRTRDAGDHVVITVEDDGVGFDMEELDKEKSVGIRNIRFRLQHLVDGTLDIASEVGKGTTVTITIPKKETETCM